MVSDNLRDVKAPVLLPGDPFVFVWVALFLILTAVAIAFYFRRKKNLSPKTVLKEEKTPKQIALEQLSALYARHLPAQGKFHSFYSELSNIVRCFFEGAFQIKAPEMTTEEFLVHLKSSHKLSQQQKERLKDFLTSCDMVKFARYHPTEAEADQIFQLAKRIVV